MLDEDEDEGSPPLRWSWLRLGTIGVNYFANFGRLVTTALDEVVEVMHRHDLWRAEQRDFHEAMTRDLETLPVESE